MHSLTVGSQFRRSDYLPPSESRAILSGSLPKYDYQVETLVCFLICARLILPKLRKWIAIVPKGECVGQIRNHNKTDQEIKNGEIYTAFGGRGVLLQG